MLQREAGSYGPERLTQELCTIAAAPLVGEGSTLQIRCAVCSLTVTPWSNHLSRAMREQFSRGTLFFG